MKENQYQKIEKIQEEVETYLGFAKESIEIAEKLKIDHSYHIISALKYIKESLNLLTPFLTLETYNPFATHLNNLANRLHAVGLKKESRLTQKIHSDFTHKVLGNLFS